MEPATLPDDNPSSGAVADRRRSVREGLISGALGGATIALWFLILDVLQHRPLYTPSLLGSAIFRPGLTSGGNPPLSLAMASLFTGIHFLVFGLIGCLASWLLAKAERNPNLGFGLILLFVVFDACFAAFATIFAEPVLKALTWPAILVANFLAATAMAIYFWKRHPKLTILP